MVRILACVLVLALWPLGVARAEPVYLGFGEHEIAFEPPPGYCAIDRGNRLEDFLAGQLEKMGGNRALMLDVSVWCDDLDAVRQGRAETFYRYTVLWVILNNGQPVDARGVSARDFKEAIRPTLAAPLDAETKAMMREALARTDAARLNVKLGKPTEFGILAEDKYALYTGHSTPVTFGGASHQMVGVGSHVLVSGLYLGFNNYQRYRDDGSLPELLNEQRAFIPTLIYLNE